MNCKGKGKSSLFVKILSWNKILKWGAELFENLYRGKRLGEGGDYGNKKAASLRKVL
jgi:hypothetical protein